MIDLNVQAPICPTSYGVVSYLILDALNKTGEFNIAYDPIGRLDTSQFEDPSFLYTFVANIKKYNKNAPCLKIFHENMLATRIGSGALIGYSFFEKDDMAEDAVHHANCCDVFCVSSEWAKGVAVKSGVSTRIEVLHPIVPTSRLYNIACDCTSGEERDTIKFLHIGKMEERKNQVNMINAFGEAFDQFHNVELSILWDSPFIIR